MKFRITERESGEFIVQYTPDFYPTKEGEPFPWVGDEPFLNLSDAEAYVLRLAEKRKRSFMRLNVIKSYVYNDDGIRIDEVKYV